MGVLFITSRTVSTLGTRKLLFLTWYLGVIKEFHSHISLRPQTEPDRKASWLCTPKTAAAGWTGIPRPRAGPLQALPVQTPPGLPQRGTALGSGRAGLVRSIAHVGHGSAPELKSSVPWPAWREAAQVRGCLLSP